MVKEEVVAEMPYLDSRHHHLWGKGATEVERASKSFPDSTADHISGKRPLQVRHGPGAGDSSLVSRTDGSLASPRAHSLG